jgi:DNA-3-methyladenine glycosylase
MQRLSKEFYEQKTLVLAESLLGKLLVKETNEGTTAGRIVETEAYQGPLDQAAHSFKNKRTKRTEVMFGPGGYAYTYVMHTHCLFNVVSAEEGCPEAVLVRAVEPYAGRELMFERRGNHHKESNLTSGPGKLTKAMGISMEDYGSSLNSGKLFIADGPKPQAVSTGPRVGIPNSGDAKAYPWRFWESGNRFVSK